MQTIDLIQEIQRQPLTKRFYVVEKTIKSIKKEEMQHKMELANSGLTKTSSADCFQIRSLSQEWVIKKLGNIDSATLNEFKEVISKVLDL